jgi:hypothetical protein
MDELDQVVPYVSCWNSVVIPVKLEPWNPDEATVDRLPSPNFVLTFLPQDFLASYSQSVQIDNTTNYVHQPADECTIQNALASLNQLFACQPGEVIEAFVTYLSPSERYVDGPWNGQRQEIGSSSAVSPVAPDRQVCLETAAKDHVIHLETMILAKEQEAPTATAVGQILISGGEVWMRWKKRLLHSLSRYSRNRSTVGFQIAFANAAQTSSY